MNVPKSYPPDSKAPRLVLNPKHHRRPMNPFWYRAIQSHFLTGTPGALPTPLSTSHTTTIPGRFNIGTPVQPSFPVLYLAENHMVALFEVQALFSGSAGRRDPAPADSMDDS